MESIRLGVVYLLTKSAMSKHTIKNKKIKKIQPPRGLVIIYTGHGKGKTTAAMGMAFRAVGAGLKVLVLQFIKGEWPNGEREVAAFLTNVPPLRLRGGEVAAGDRGEGALRDLGRVHNSPQPSLTLREGGFSDLKLGSLEFRTGGRGFVKILGDKKTLAEHRAAARALFNESLKSLEAGLHDLIVLDEIISAWEENLLSKKDLVKLIKAKPEKVHLVMTGHDAPREIVELADLVTEMKKIKHPFDQGLLAQKGIDF